MATKINLIKPSQEIHLIESDDLDAATVYQITYDGDNYLLFPMRGGVRLAYDMSHSCWTHFGVSKYSVSSAVEIQSMDIKFNA